MNRAIGVLRDQFLPDPFDPLGVYPDAARVQAFTRAFLVLSHAEVESYLEDWAKDIARASEVVWTASTRMSEPMAFLVAALSERIVIPTKLMAPGATDGPQQLAAASVKLYQKYYKQIRDNNGIREKNVLALFGPLGVPSSALGATLLPNLDSLGALRGVHAHQAAAKAVHSVLDPETEHTRVGNLLTDLKLLDQWLVSCRRRIR